MCRMAVNATLVFTSMLMTCLAGEVMLRWAGIGYGHSPLEASRRLHHVHPASYSFVSYDPAGEFGGHMVSYDADGYRVDERQHPRTQPSGIGGHRRIAFLGDSFTEAITVSWQDSFIGRLEHANPDLITRNFGVSSYAPLQYLIQMRQDVPAFRPTDLVLQLYANDFDDDSAYLTRASSRDLDTVASIDGGDRDLVITVLRHSYLARLVRRGQLVLCHMISYAQKDPARTLGRLPGNEELSLAIVSRIKRETESLGARFYLFIVPDKILAQHNACCAEDHWSAAVAAFADSEGISYVVLVHVFGKQRDQNRLFWQRAIHFSSEGNLIVARAIAEKLDLSLP